MSPPITRKFPKIDQKKKHTEHERNVKNGVFDRGTQVYFRVFHGIFGIFSWKSVVLALVSLVSSHVQLIVCAIWTYKRALCMAGVYIATKKVSALTVSVWCVRVWYSSRAQCTKNVHPLVLSVFFFYAFFSKTSDRMQSPESARNKKKKKSALTLIRRYSASYY